MAKPLELGRFMAPGGMNDSVALADMDPAENEAPMVWNGVFNKDNTVSKRPGSLRLYRLAELVNPAAGPVVVAG